MSFARNCSFLIVCGTFSAAPCMCQDDANVLKADRRAYVHNTYTAYTRPRYSEHVSTYRPLLKWSLHLDIC